MTIHIPVKLLLFVLYTCAVLGGAFGISYAVFEWRHDDPLAVIVQPVATTTSGVSSIDASLCHDALADLTLALGELLSSNALGPALKASVSDIELAIDQHC